MSYIRSGSILRYTIGESDAYIFPSNDGENRYVEDYGNLGNQPTFLELIGRLAERETGDKDFAMRVVKRAAKEMNCEFWVRENILTDEEYFKLEKERIEEINKLNI